MTPFMGLDMKASRKHFEQIARMIKKHHGNLLGMSSASNREASIAHEVTELAKDMAFVLSQANGSFDRGKFLTACGIDESKHGM